MKKIALIGAGQMGSRHLQALAYLKTEACIQVVEPNKENLVIARGRFEDVTHKKNVKYLDGIQQLSEDIDLAIVATNATFRKQIIEQLVKKKGIKKLILEKVVFQGPADFYDVKELFSQKEVKAWVNCARRSWDFYQDLKKELSTPFYIEAFGSKWGMASNAIHILDLASFLGAEGPYEIDSKLLNPKIINSKRQGFYEINGTFSGKFECGSHFTITSYDEGDAPFVVQLHWPQGKYTFFESLGQYFFANELREWDVREGDITVPFQSQLSQEYCDDIFETGDCILCPFEESADLHIPMLQIFSEHFNKHLKGESGCPIT